METNFDIKSIAAIFLPLFLHHGVKRASLFGSYARGEADSDSDIDLLVQLEESKSLLDLIQLETELEKLIGKKIDLLTFDSINPLLRETIFSDEVILYDEKGTENIPAAHS